MDHNVAEQAETVDGTTPTSCPSGLCPTLAHTYDQNRHDCRGWLLSEKLDGVRAVWDGLRLRTRTGRSIYAPSWWTNGLPRVMLDGELYIGRGRFDDVSGIVRSRDAGRAWEDVALHAFDLYADARPYRERYDHLRSLSGVVCVVEQRPVLTRGQIVSFMNEVCLGGGEGVILRDPTAPYVFGRTDSLLKHKPVRDLDAVVVAHEGGRGRLAGSLGALVCRVVETGVEFRIGTGFSDAHRDEPPAIGTTVVVQYQELTKRGLPRFARFAGVRAEGIVA